MAESREAHVSAVAALDEPTRRRLYDYVVRQSESVSRDDAATAMQLPRATAAFHLDRLVDEGLLDVVHERRTGRTGPGAGRPSKLYHRSSRQIAVSLPDRRYELAGRLLAAAVQEADDSGKSPRAVLDRRARAEGKELGEAARSAHNSHGMHDAVLRTLAAYGFEPLVVHDEVVLGNCPFHSLAKEHTNLVCGMNLHLLEGVLDGLNATGFTARLQPAPGHCCVRIAPTHS
jgi:predicted ArsR family transcriptional regulator